MAPLSDGRQTLELGAATGALAAWLTMRGAAVTTTDVSDGGDVARNVAATFALNALPDTHVHVEHTWGETIPAALLEPPFPLIVAVDILLYVKAYPALLKTLGMLLVPRDGVRPRLLMGWERRFKGADAPFFDNLADVGLSCTHLGKRIYSITATVGGADPMDAEVYR